MGKIISVFRESGRDPSAKIMRPTERAFLEIIGVPKDTLPLTHSRLKEIFAEDCNRPALSDREKLRRFNERVAWITKQIKDTYERFHDVFGSPQCPDDILVMGLDVFRSPEYYNRLYDVDDVLKNNLITFAENVTDFLHGACPTQGDYALLSRIEQFLVAGYVCDTAQDLIDKKNGVTHSPLSVIAYKKNVDPFMKFSDINYGDNALGIQCNAQISTLRKIMQDINAKHAHPMQSPQ